MSDNLSAFIDFLIKNDCPPERQSDIIATNKWTDYQIVGDKAGTKKGYYILKTDGDFISGACGDRRTGITHQFYNKPDRKLTDEERREYARKRERDKKQQHEDELKRYETGAAEAKAIWQAAKPAIEHEYLTRKRILPHGVRLNASGDLVVPLYFENRIMSIQTIAPNGDKDFLFRGRMKDCYYPLASKDDDRRHIYICEGFATAATVREATKSPTVCAFNAGNLPKVAKAMRVKYPHAKIIIAGDNDESGTGQLKATEAARAVDGIAIWPDNLENDWNDVHNLDGLDYVTDLIIDKVSRGGNCADKGGETDVSFSEDRVQPSVPDLDNVPEWVNELPPLEFYEEEARRAVGLYNPSNGEKDPNWKERLYYKEDKDGNSKLVSKSMNNVLLFLENHPVLSNLVCYDEFAREKVVYQAPPWDKKPEKFLPRLWSDDDNTMLTCALERIGLIQPTSTIKKLVEATVKNNARNPAREYFSGLVWDNTPRLDDWLLKYCGCVNDDPDYVRAIGRKWLTAAVARVFEPGKKFDHILILEGEQNAGKSLLLKELSTIHGKAYFEDTIRVHDLGVDKVVPKMQGVLIIEIAEMAGLDKKDADELKQAIAITTDSIVRKFENERTYYPRQFVFAGTINPTDGYLRDVTGNRRFWPVKVADKIDMEGLRADKEQLWAEAYYRYQEGEKLYLEDELYDKAMNAQRERTYVHPLQQDIERITAHKLFVTNDEIWNGLGVVDKIKRTQGLAQEVGKILISLGFNKVRIRQEGERRYGWERKS